MTPPNGFPRCRKPAFAQLRDGTYLIGEIVTGTLIRMDLAQLRELALEIGAAITEADARVPVDACTARTVR